MLRLLRLFTLIRDAERRTCGETDQRTDVLRGLLRFDLPAEFFRILCLSVEKLTGVQQRFDTLSERAEREFGLARELGAFQIPKERFALLFPAGRAYPSFRSMTIPQTVPSATSSRSATIPSRVIHFRAELIRFWSCEFVLQTISRRALSVEPSID